MTDDIKDDNHWWIVQHQRFMIDTAERQLERRLKLGHPVTHLQRYRAEKFADLLAYQLETFRRQ